MVRDKYDSIGAGMFNGFSKKIQKQESHVPAGRHLALESITHESLPPISKAFRVEIIALEIIALGEGAFHAMDAKGAKKNGRKLWLSSVEPLALVATFA